MSSKTGYTLAGHGFLIYLNLGLLTPNVATESDDLSFLILKCH